MDLNSYSKSHNRCCCSVDNPSLLLSNNVSIVSSWFGGFGVISQFPVPLSVALLAASSPTVSGWGSELSGCDRS